jgi:cobalt-zinc-cadmium efflux system membrane fusion protein
MVVLAPCGCSKDQKVEAKPGQGDGETKADAAGAGKAGMCAHSAPKELCFYCDASLRQKGRLWCKEHNRYEDRCWICHPEAQDKNRLWCKEHFLYEDECFLCHPELKGTGPAGRGTGTAAKPEGAKVLCKEHGVPEGECGICHPDLVAKLKAGEGMKVRLPSTNSTRVVGVETAVTESGVIADGLECVAEVSFNQRKLAQITPLVGGVVKSVEVDLGSRVNQGDLLARVSSVAIGEAQATYRKAIAEDRLRDKTAERERNLRAQRISSEKELQEAEAAHEAAMAAVQQAGEQLKVLGFDEQQIQALAERKGTPGVLEIRAPFAGEIAERSAVQGGLAEMGKPLFTLVDPSTVWAMLQVPEGALARVKVGQTVELRVDSLPGQVFTGKLTWIGGAVDERTRMARARAEFANPERLLRDKMFAMARILIRQAEGALLIPESAIEHVEGTPLVFVRIAEDLFDARAVQLGANFNGRWEVLTGLKPQERIVVSRAFALKSALLISRLGAGCVDD